MPLVNNFEKLSREDDESAEENGTERRGETHAAFIPAFLDILTYLYALYSHEMATSACFNHLVQLLWLYVGLVLCIVTICSYLQTPTDEYNTED